MFPNIRHQQRVPSVFSNHSNTLRNTMNRSSWIILICLLLTQHSVFGQSGSLFQNPTAQPMSDYNSAYRPAYPAQVPPYAAFQGAMPSPDGGAPYYGPSGGYYSNGTWVDNPTNIPSIQSSFTYQPPMPARVLKVNDLVSIRVEELGQMIAQGNTTSRKTVTLDAVLQDWIRLVGLDTIKPAPQSDGEPRARFNENEVYRGDSTMRTSEQLTFNIAAKIMDIQPNGNIVLEARKTISATDNTFAASLSGICRAQDIGPDNVVLSRNIYDLNIKKEDQGHVRDGYSRGWLTKWYARLKPF